MEIAGHLENYEEKKSNRVEHTQLLFFEAILFYS